MFTGIVTHLGKITSARTRDGLLSLEIASPDVAKELHKGDSVSVNGVCLTAVGTSRRRFAAEVMGETLARSTFEGLGKGAVVNLELPARLGDRLGGHLVQGHVDGIAFVVRIEDDDGFRRLWLEAPEEVLRYLVSKGSVALDGVALTVVEAGRTSFQVAVIPHTLQETTFGALKVGSKVNVEVDVLAKYVEKFVDRGAASAGPQERRK